MEKILPINHKPKLQIECWTYYKMVVIESLPNYMNWLSAHMNIYGGNMGEGLYYGTGPKPYKANYYSDILSIEEIDLYLVKPDKIVPKIKSEIDNGYYFVVYLRNDDNVSHEVFIYGYNDEHRSFYSLELSKSGIHSPSFITYDEVKTRYENNYKYIINNIERYYEKSDFGFSMYRMKPLDKYATKNYALEYFEMLYHEVYGTRTDQHYSEISDGYLPPHSYFTGVTCLLKVKDSINSLIEKSSEYMLSSEDIIKKNLFKMLEHRNLIYESMEWYAKRWNILDSSLHSLQEKYHECCLDMNSICMLFLKYTVTHNVNILNNIVERISKQYQSEKMILGEYVIKIREYYCSNVLLNEFTSEK